MYYGRSRKAIFLEDFLPKIPMGGRFSTEEAFKWFQRDYPLFKESGVRWLLRYLSDKRTKALKDYPIVLKWVSGSEWKRIV